MTTQEARERLQRAGYRVTKQRMAIYQTLAASDSHPTVDELHHAVCAAFPNISLATVYNAVDSLVDVGLARKIHRGASSARYDAGYEDHAHFRCVDCDDIWDVPMPSLPTSAVADGFDAGEVIGVNVEFFGYCPKCRRRKLGLPPISERERPVP